MKKVFLSLFVLATTLLISCSNDDDAVGQDPIIGKWNFFSLAEIVDGQVGTPVEGSECKKRGFLEFKEDGTLISTPYAEDQGECIIDGEATGKWANIGDGNYRFEIGTNSNNVPVKFEENRLILTSSEEETIYQKL